MTYRLVDRWPNWFTFNKRTWFEFLISKHSHKRGIRSEKTFLKSSTHLWSLATRLEIVDLYQSSVDITDTYQGHVAFIALFFKTFVSITTTMPGVVPYIGGAEARRLKILFNSFRWTFLMCSNSVEVCIIQFLNNTQNKRLNNLAGKTRRIIFWILFLHFSLENLNQLLQVMRSDKFIFNEPYLWAHSIGIVSKLSKLFGFSMVWNESFRSFDHRLSKIFSKSKCRNSMDSELIAIPGM